VQAHAQSASPQVAPSPWSVHDAVGLPSDFKLRASVRVRLESIDQQARPGFNASDTTLELRSTLFGEYQTGAVRIGAEIYDSRDYFTNRGTPFGTNEVNIAEFVQAYVALDMVHPFGAGSAAKVQLGRMAINLGSRRLVSSEDWRNTTNGYTGLRGDVALPQGLTATAIYVLPTVRLPNNVDGLIHNQFALDRESFDQVLWGGIVAKARAVGGATVEGTFLHLGERDSAGRPTRDRSLDTYGGRMFRDPQAGRVDFEIEAFHQTGRISTSAASGAPMQNVSADFFHADLGYSFNAAWSPRVSARFDYVSGDRGGSRYGRFDTLYGMRGAELAQSGLYNTVGRANALTPGVFLELAPSKRSDLFLHYRALWLAPRTDSFSTSNIRDVTGRSGRFAGHQVEVRWRHWLVTNALRFEANGIYLFKGRFLRTGPNAPATGDTRYGAVNLTAFF
jgi:hypothetical protein